MSRIRILLVDDDEDEHDLVRAALSAARPGAYQVDWEPDPERAYQAMVANRYDCYLLDYRLGPHDGTELLRRAIGDGCRQPIIVLTAFGDRSLDERCLELGAADYLVKGRYDGEQLDRSIRYTREHVAVQRQLADSEERHRVLVELCPDAIVVHRGGEVLLLNRAARELFALPDDQPCDRLDLADLGLAPHDVEPTECRSAPRPVRLHVAGRGTLELETIGVPLRYGDEPAVLSLLRDVTARNRMEAELVRSERLSAIGSLAAGLAHEYNNLLMLVTGHLERALPLVGGHEEAARHLERASQAAWRAAQLTGNVLKLSAGRPHARRIDLRSVVNDALQMSMGDLSSAGVHVASHLASGCYAEVDPVQLTQVLVHLITNARQAMEDAVVKGLDIRLRHAEGGGESRIDITDTGRGIPEHLLPSIFSPFVAGGDDAGRGGLGLSVSDAVVRRHGGRLEVTSRPGMGTTFSVVLPYAGHAVLPLPQAVEEAADPSLPSLRVLVLEDDAVLLDLVIGACQAAGLEAFPALDAESTRRLLGERAFDVVVVNVDAVEEGPAFLEEVHAAVGDRPLCIATVDRERAGELEDAPCALVLLKPYPVNELLAAIRDLQGRHDQRRHGAA